MWLSSTGKSPRRSTERAGIILRARVGFQTNAFVVWRSRIRKEKGRKMLRMCNLEARVGIHHLSLSIPLILQDFLHISTFK
jgi:hypothetical protein